MPSVKYEDLELAFDFVSSGASMEHNAYISLDAGTIHWVSGDDALGEELPSDFDTSDRYIAIPHKNDLDLGRQLVTRFAEIELPDHSGKIRGFFSNRGAYARFKDFLASIGRLEAWYRFERETTEKALTEWCRENGVQVVKDGANK